VIEGIVVQDVVVGSDWLLKQNKNFIELRENPRRVGFPFEGAAGLEGWVTRYNSNVLAKLNQSHNNNLYWYLDF
jgi:hypothetical protein